MKLALPSETREEIIDVARRAGRSTAFVVRRALAAAVKEPPAEAATGSKAPLELLLGDDDPPHTLKRIRELAAARGGDLDLGAAVASAWASTRAQFFAWVSRQEEADRASRADDLDSALDEAGATNTAPERLSLLATHEYVQVRARVASNHSTPPEALERLAAERDRTLRARLLANPSLPAAARARLAR